MKQIITNTIALLSMLILSVNTYAFDFEVDGICYDVISPADLTCGVCGVIDKESIKSVIIPEHVSYLGKDLTVTTIYSNAFRECTKLSEINIPQSVTAIYDYVFEDCCALEKITFPPSLKEIGYKAFNGCDNLTSVNISDFKAWCEMKFSSNPLSNHKAQLLLRGELISSKLSFDDSITKIGKYAFEGYAYITEVNLSDNIQSIGEGSFAGCPNIEKISIGQGLTQIPSGAFTRCTNLTYLHIDDSEKGLIFKGRVISGYDKMGGGDFVGCNLKEIYIGRDLYQSSDYYYRYPIFYQQEVESVTIGPKVSFISKYYFLGDYEGSYGVKNINKFIICPSEIPLECMFTTENNNENYSALTFINPNTLILGRDLIPKYHYKYKDYTYFEECTDLNYLEIGENVTDIGHLLPLNKNDNISNITVKTSIPPELSGGPGFTKKTYLHTLLKVPNESLPAYKSAIIWKNFWNIEGSDFSSIENIEYNNNPMNIIVENGSIKIMNKDDGKIVRVYSIHGTKIAETSEDTVHNLSDGVYIVTVGTESFKVVVR